MADFTDKTVWITGASSGIGEALVYAFDKGNANIVISSRRIPELEKVKNNCINKDRIFILPLDLEKSGEFSSLTQKVIEKFGRIDILVNNGGISQRANASDTSLETDRKIMEVNFFGNIALTKAVLPQMKKQKSGKIVVMSSIAGKFGFFLRSTYSASKHALHGFYESLRLEEEKNGISVLLVCPGKIKTDISLHALTGSGGSHNKMDQSQESGMPAADCAEKIMEAILKNKEEVLIGRKEIKAVNLKRLFPRLFGKVIRKQKLD